MTLILKDNNSKEITHKERIEHQKWCFKNDIIIYFQLVTWQEGRIIIEDKGKKRIIDEIYPEFRPTKKQPKPKAKALQHYKKVWELYTEYYNKYN